MNYELKNSLVNSENINQFKLFMIVDLDYSPNDKLIALVSHKNHGIFPDYEIASKALKQLEMASDEYKKLVALDNLAIVGLTEDDLKML